MTIGSAASLADRRPQAPFPTFRSVRRDGRLPVLSNVPAWNLPRRHFPRNALADDPPRGRILVVAGQAALALEVQRILREAGYRTVGPAESAEEAGRLIERGPIDGAVVDLDLAGGAATVGHRLAQESIPFVGLGDAPATAPSVSKSALGAELVAALERALSIGTRSGDSHFYPVPPPQEVWPRVFPQL